MPNHHELGMPSTKQHGFIESETLRKKGRTTEARLRSLNLCAVGRSNFDRSPLKNLEFMNQICTVHSSERKYLNNH